MLKCVLSLFFSQTIDYTLTELTQLCIENITRILYSSEGKTEEKESCAKFWQVSTLKCVLMNNFRSIYSTKIQDILFVLSCVQLPELTQYYIRNTVRVIYMFEEKKRCKRSYTKNSSNRTLVYWLSCFFPETLESRIHCASNDNVLYEEHNEGNLLSWYYVRNTMRVIYSLDVMWGTQWE